MKIVKLKGGLGNQMFQYSFAKLLEKHTGDTVKIDLSSYNSLKNDTIRVPRITKFRLSLETATSKDIENVCMLKHRGNSQSFAYRAGIAIEKTINKNYFFEPNRAYIDINSISERQYFDGYWQSHRYVEAVRRELLNDFTSSKEISVNTLSLMDTIGMQNAVFIGVRKGDYSANKKAVAHYGEFSSEYYLKAMDYINSRVKSPVFYVFSNDIEWSKNNLNWGSYNVIFREKEDQTDDFEELILMSSCKHAIIVNSTYNWWGAFLINNPDKIVCCPQKWFFDDKPIDIIPEQWVKI